MKAILFPTDFSINANHALSYAVAIAEKAKAKLIILNVFWVPVYDTGTPPEIRTKEKKAKKESLKGLEELEYKILKEHPGLSVEVVTQNGFVVESILQMIETHHVDLVIMGTKGASGIKEIIMGSNTVDLINKASCSILAIPDKFKALRFEKFVFATDYKEGHAEELEFLINIAYLFDAEITVLHVSEGEYTESTERMILRRFKKGVAIEAPYEKLKYRLVKGDVTEQLSSFIEKHDIDLIAMVTHQRYFLSKIFNKSHTQQLAFHLEIPLLALHQNVD